MKKIISLLGVIGLGISSASSVVSCNIFGEDEIGIKVDRNLSMKIGGTWTFTIRNYSDLKNLNVRFEGDSIIEIIEQSESSFTIKAIDYGTVRIYYTADNATEAQSSIFINYRDEIEYEMLADNSTIQNNGEFVDLIKVLDYKNLLNFSINFESNLIEEYKISDEGIVSVKCSNENITESVSTYFTMKEDYNYEVKGYFSIEPYTEVF